MHMLRRLAVIKRGWGLKGKNNSHYTSQKEFSEDVHLSFTDTQVFRALLKKAAKRRC